MNLLVNYGINSNAIESKEQIHLLFYLRFESDSLKATPKDSHEPLTTVSHIWIIWVVLVVILAYGEEFTAFTVKQYNQVQN